MHCHLSDVHIRKVPKFLARSPSVTTYITKLFDPFDATYTLLIPLQLSRVTSYFDVHSLAEYDNKDIP